MCCITARHEVAVRNINVHRTKMCTAIPTHSDLSTDGFQCRVTTNPERLAEEESIEMTIDGKSCKSSELKLSGQCSTSYTCSDRSPVDKCFAGTDWPDLCNSACTVFITRVFMVVSDLCGLARNPHCGLVAVGRCICIYV